MSYIKSDEFTEICYENDCDPYQVKSALEALGKTVSITQVRNRIANYRRKGLLTLESGNKVDSATILKGTSTLYGPDGSIKQQWVKSDVPKEEFLHHLQEAIKDITSDIEPLPTVQPHQATQNEDLATLYVSNDAHFGALMWAEESGKDWDTQIAYNTYCEAFDALVEQAPPSKYGIVSDLGDLLEVDDFKNMTPHSGNILSVDSRYQKILRTAYKALIYSVNKALTKHDIVYVYNIAGNHDTSSGVAIREILYVAFENNPRVIVDDSPMNIKYHQHGSTLLGFAHGDGLKLRNAGETMAHDKADIFSQTKYRYFHFGHTHKDAVYDSRLCKAESHRNLAPLNHWAFDKGFRGLPGSMKSITYHTSKGEISRNIYSLS